MLVSHMLGSGQESKAERSCFVSQMAAAELSGMGGPVLVCLREV